MDVNTSRATHVFPDVALRMKELKTLVVTRATSYLQDQIETEAAGLEAALYEFKTLRNSCAALLRMPPEVLLQIVDSLFLIWPAQHPACTSNKDPLGWIALSHVCRRLRDVLLDTKYLWARSICTLPRARDCMLSRAGDMPLSLMLFHPRMRLEDVEFLINHLPQARTAQIEDSDWSSDGTWILEPAQFSQKALPFLEELVLKMEDREEQLDLLTPDVWELPPPITPRLRLLHLNCMAIPFSPTTLTALTVSFDARPSHLYTPPQFLGILRQCKLLRELTLSYATPLYPFNTGNSRHPTVDLPVLRRLHVRDGIDHCIGLWNSISVPPPCTVVMHIYEIQFRYPDPCSHLQVIPSHLQFAVEAPITGISIWDEEGVHSDGIALDDAVVSWLVSDTGRENTTWTGPFEHDFKERMSLYMYGIDIGKPHFLQLLARAVDVIDLTQLQVLEIGSWQAYNSARWTAALTPFLNVKILSLKNMPQTSLLLSLMPSSYDNQEAAPLLLPALRFLWLSNLEPEELDAGIASPKPNRVQFVRMLAARKQSGSPIEHLRIGELHMDTTQAERSFLPRIRAIVPLVECDAIVSTGPV